MPELAYGALWFLKFVLRSLPERCGNESIAAERCAHLPPDEWQMCLPGYFGDEIVAQAKLRENEAGAPR